MGVRPHPYTTRSVSRGDCGMRRSPALAATAEEVVVRALRGQEGQRAVVQHHVQDDAAAHVRAAVGADVAHRAFRVQHAALLGAEQRRLGEHVPAADGAAPLRDRRLVLREVEAEATDLRTVGGVQLDGRRQPCRREVGLAPQVEGGVGRHASRLAGHGRDPIGEAADGIDLRQRRVEVALEFARVGDDLRGVLRADQVRRAWSTACRSSG